MKLKDIATAEKIQEYIEEHIRENILIGTLCEKFSFNRDKLQRLFKELLGDTVAEYITKQKIYYGAERLLNSDDSVTKIAENVSFSKSYFIKRFKAEYHCTPNEYKKQYQVRPTLSNTPRTPYPASIQR